MVRARQWPVIGLALGLGAAFLAGFAGPVHPAGDSFAVFRFPVAVLLGLVAIWSPWPAGLRWLVAVICLGAMGHIVAQKYVTHPAGPVTVYQKNLQFQNDRVNDLEADIRAAAPDIVALQELTSRNAPLVRALRGSYPHQASCALTSWARVAILTRWPVEGEICLEDKGLVGVLIASPQGRFWAFSLHAFWPWPHGQATQMAEILPVLEGLEDPVVLAGDFNMVPWSHVLNHMGDATGTTRAGPLFPTLRKLGMPLPVDHVYAPGGGRASARGLLGSDHNGVLAEVVVFE